MGDGDGGGSSKEGKVDFGLLCGWCHLPFSTVLQDRDPIALNCIHTFCRGCVREIVDNAPKDNTDGEGSGSEDGDTACPICGVPSDLDAQHLVVRHALLRAVAHAEDSDGEVENEEDSDAGDDKGRKPSVCEAHNKPATLVAIPNGKYLCEACERDEGVKVRSLQEAVEEARADVETLASLVQARMSDLQGAAANVRKRRDEAFREAVRAERDVTLFFEELEKHKQRLLGAIHQVKKDISQQVTDIEATTRVLQHNLDHALASARASNPSTDSLVQASAQLKQFLIASDDVATTPVVSVHITFKPFPTVREFTSRCSVVVGKPNVQKPPRTRMLTVGEPGVPSLLRAFPFPGVPMLFARWSFATAATDHGVYALGGFGGLRKAESLLVEEKEWTPLPPMPTERSGCGACVGDGKLYVVGGQYCGEALSSCEVFDPAEGRWTRAESMSIRRNGCGVVFCEGRVVVAGGQDGDWRQVTSAEWLDVATGSWSQVLSMNGARAWFGAAACDHRVFACGGEFDGEALDACEMLDTRSGRWLAMAPLPQPRKHCGAAIASDHVVVCGGHDGKAALSSVVAYGLANGAWVGMRDMSSVRRGCCVVCVHNRLLVLGGINGGGSTLASVDVYEF